MDHNKYNNQFQPDTRLYTKIKVEIALFIVIFLLILVISAIAVAPDEVLVIIGIFFLVGVILYLIISQVVKLYLNSINYQVTDNEVLVNKGVITKTNKIVPFRTITNIELHRGPFDRIFDLATIDVQTAGSTRPNSGPEEKLIGLNVENAQEIKDLIQSKIKYIQGTPATSLDPDFPLDNDNVVKLLVNEIIIIRKLLESKFKSK